MKAVVFTLGCKVNSCESDSLINGLVKLGYEVSSELSYADLYIINTCAVTSEAEKKSRQSISRIKKYNDKAKIIVTGCASEKSPKDFLNKENVTLITGARAKSKILSLIAESGEKICEDDSVFDELQPAKSLKTRTYIKIQDGCNNFCSYCIVPYLRGRSRSRKLESIVEEFLNIDSKEVVITGINISSYNDNGRTLTDLLLALKDFSVRIRLGSLEVNIITKEMLDATKMLKNFAPQFHLSLQSGSDNVLKEMNRKYTAKYYLDKVNLIRSYYPLCAITTDVIAGFPLESDKDFEDSLKFLNEVEFSQIHAFCYSKRSGTKAAKLTEVDTTIKKERLNKLLQLSKILKDRYLQKFIGKELEVLFEETIDNYAVGHSENYIKVYASPTKNLLKTEDKNSVKTEAILDGMQKIKITKLYKDGVVGEVI